MTTENALATINSLLATPIMADSAKESAPRGLPYVGFRGMKSVKNVAALEAAGIGVDKFYLFDGEPLKVDPFYLHVLAAARLWTVLDDDNKIVDATFTDPGNDSDYREHIFAAVVVPLGNTFVAATSMFRSGHVLCLKQALSFLSPGGAASDAKSWASRGPAHAKSAGDDQTPPGFRFRVQIASTREKPQSGGQPYNKGHAIITPTPEESFRSLLTWKEANTPRIVQVLNANAARVAEARRLANG